jgi:DNA polymerase-3 subunit epsilon
MSARQEAAAVARRWLEQDALFLDTETTGLHAGAEIVELTLIDRHGQPVLDTLIRPEQPIPAALTRIHGISNTMVARAPRWPEVHEQLLSLIQGRELVIYNAEFDLRMLTQVAAQHRLPWPAVEERRGTQTRLANATVAHCAMLEYSRFYGSRRWQSLSKACEQQGITVSGAHRALADCRMTLNVVQAMARQAG